MKLKSTKNMTNKTRLKLWVLDFEDRRHRTFTIIFVCFVCLLLTYFFLYEPAKNFYKGIREKEKLNIQIQILKDYNQQLSENIEFLQTEEGIKQTAKQKLNFVQEGESSAYVNNLENLKLEETPSEFSARYNSKNTIYNNSWYTNILDKVFGVTEYNAKN